MVGWAQYQPYGHGCLVGADGQLCVQIKSTHGLAAAAVLATSKKCSTSTSSFLDRGVLRQESVGMEIART